MHGVGVRGHGFLNIIYNYRMVGGSGGSPPINDSQGNNDNYNH
jgi:hypothetical protein